VVFPTTAALADADPALLPLTEARRRTVLALTREIDDGRLVVSGTADRDELRARLLATPGIGEWTVECILMRLGDPDAFPATDLGVRRALAALGGPDDAAAAVRQAEAWRPWRSYAVQHLWGVGSRVVTRRRIGGRR